jgi:hypothetical protein
MVQAYKEQRRELEVVYGAAQAAQRALKMAQAELSRLQDQIDQIPAQSPAPIAADAHQSMTLIHHLAKLSIDKQIEHRSNVKVGKETTSDMCNFEPVEPEVYQRAAAKNEQPRKNPSGMRVNLVEAEPQISRVSQLRADFLSKTLRCEELRLFCKRMEARMIQWALRA